MPAPLLRLSLNTSDSERMFDSPALTARGRLASRASIGRRPLALAGGRNTQPDRRGGRSLNPGRLFVQCPPMPAIFVVATENKAIVREVLVVRRWGSAASEDRPRRIVETAAPVRATLFPTAQSRSTSRIRSFAGPRSDRRRQQGREVLGRDRNLLGHAVRSDAIPISLSTRR